MNRENNDNKTQRLVLISLMMCLILLGTMFFRIPIPMTQGYVHLGDAMIYLAVLLLGKRSGSVAAGLGSALGDILGGYAFWAPWTLIIKFFMAFITGTILERAAGTAVDSDKHSNSASSFTKVLAMVAGGLVMTAGYLIVERFMYGSWGAASLGVPWNIGQFVAGIVVSLLLSAALDRVHFHGKLISR